MTTLAGIEGRLAPQGLAILGGFAAAPEDGLPSGTLTLLMIGPDGPGFWPVLTASDEWQDGRPDPVDRWSRRVIGRLACELGAKALFPFGGPPHHPFFTWATRTGRCHQSPVQLLVHDQAGLWVSFRGALALKELIDLPPPPPSPCDSCEGMPCLTACPPLALTGAGYDVPACRAFLDTQAGGDCMANGCAVRRACPVSVGHARMREQSAYHMGQFHR
ncbi:ferredoxin [Tabrizicola sp. J26]|uniref:ferredoxin n=1 Tax=Alitabrizicola rongguiensis TaxID=2909234 RepID=UPI001F250558|nr:ferredoxin [Tabrizicola rongguiensis]MCF1707576.1 ferredoxin [Tabrizicola rongguiensis]